MKECTPISRKYFEKVDNKACKVSIDLFEVIKMLSSIKTDINLTDEEIAVLNQTRTILEDKMEIIEDMLDNENIEFYNEECQEHDF